MNVTMPDGTLIEGVPDDYTKEQVLSMYEKQKPKPVTDVPKELTTGEKALGGTRSFLEGQTMGFADEIGAFMAAMKATTDPRTKHIPWQESYRDIKKSLSGEQQEFERQNQGLALGLNVAGGLLTALPTGGAAYASRFGQMNPVKTAVGLGAAGGAVSGTGYAPEMKDVPAYAGLGAAGGAALAPAGYYAGKLLSKGAGAVGRMLKPEAPQTTISRTVGHYAGQDEVTPEQMIKAARLMGSEATLSDVGGQNLKSLAMTVAQKGGSQKTAALKGFAERQKGATKRIMKSLRSLSGGDENFFKNQKAIVDRRFKEASPLYEAAKKESLSTDDMVGVFNKVQSVVDDYNPSRGMLKEFTKGKGEHKVFKTSIKELHSLQRQLRAASNTKYKAGDNELGAAYKKMHKIIIDELSAKNPNYAAGRKIWAGESALDDAIKSGRNILKEDADFVSDNLASLSKSEQEAYISGAVKTIRDKLMVGRESSNTATKLASQLVRERLRGAFPDDQSFNQFINRLDIEDEFAQTYQKIYGGSQTQPRLQGESDLADVIKGGKAIHMEGSDAITKVGNAVKSVLDVEVVPQVVIDDITRLMSTPVHKIPKKQLESLMKHGISKADLNKIRGHISGSITGQVVPQTQREMSR